MPDVTHRFIHPIRIPRLETLKADDFLFPNTPAQYRRRMRSLLIRIAEQQPDLIPESQIDIDDYRLHS
jgi:hypothetical protein